MTTKTGILTFLISVLIFPKIVLATSISNDDLMCYEMEYTGEEFDRKALSEEDSGRKCGNSTGGHRCFRADYKAEIGTENEQYSIKSM